MPGTNLTRDEARHRSQVVSDVSYDVELDLMTGPTTFTTTTTARFRATPGAETFLDLVGDSVQEIVLNGRHLDPAEAYADSRIHLPDLAADNEVLVRATGIYMNTGEGLHRFVDPADGEVYLYTQFEVPDSRRMFAVFEQPDVKATFAFTVTAPAHWQVISASPTPEPTDAGERDGVAAGRWEFAPTPRLSSYVTSLIAGPYDRVTSSVSTRAGEIPLGIFSRRSLTPFVDHDELFDITRRGFGFFEEEFDLAFPFAKYDQIFTPEYNMGAMENVGAVTFHEMYVFRAKVSEATVERRALTILHELAHMWFGNLVTMTWWDDLWLNESFAEWASTTAQAEATRWTSAWTTFGTAEKAWAYRQDQLSSTHPIAADIRDLADVETNFDGITYAKGASVLKQLVAYVGRDAFRDGLRAYFVKHAWGNTEIGDLMRELEATSGRDLGRWQELWLEQAGVTTLSPELEVTDGVIRSAAIVQTAPSGSPVLRPHRLAVGCYALQGDSLHRTDRYEVDVDGARTELPMLVGRPAPDVLLVNDDDLAYAKLRLDPASLACVVAQPRAFTDSLPRSLALAAAWDMTRDAEMRASDYVALALRAVDGEEDATLLRVLLAQLATALGAYVAPEHRDTLRDQVAAELRRLAEASAPGSDAQLQLVSALLAVSTRETDLDLAQGLLEGSLALDGLAVDADMRWTLLVALAAGGRADAATIESEKTRDNTASGHERAAVALAARPTAAAKAEAWRRGVEDASESNTIVGSTAAGFGRVHDLALLEPYVDRYFAMLLGMWERHSFALGEVVARSFYPMPLADARLLAGTEAWLEAHGDAPAGLVRVVQEHRDTVARALRVQARDAA
ncbi:aminopeptidase N [Arsenicicoccus sp. oral taxon 190]|uniref:aminopeptidase N n=1 Tax=Arsenicicoccus sp. oral taxon 190 TaxID=1658671 RepID=UPI00067A3E6D|nr:aminopeptidase N [Arsenicicoccus sp. oral taxon 190]AKT51516.1 aminopeptidase N [Arsenicicoccus sp. oral taxon 190]